VRRIISWPRQRAIDAKGNFTGEKVSIRYRGDFLEVEPARVSYMDISPKQLVSVAAGPDPVSGT